MCCRYYYADETDKLIMELLSDESSVNQKGYAPTSGKTVHPSDMATIITGRGQGLAAMTAEEMRWGFPLPSTKQLVINARAESALERKMFSESLLRRRCIIPAKHFYEWDREKTKNTFSLEHDPVIFMAGFFNRFQDEDRFVILTTGANASMSPVHDRMPLILPKQEIEDWIYEDDMVRDFLGKASPELMRSVEFEQMSLW